MVRIHGLTLAVLFSILFYFGMTARAASVASFCSTLGDNPRQTAGYEINKKVIIASVTKMLTTYWAIAAQSLHQRFPLKIIIDPVPSGVDLYWQGSRDPLFSLEALQLLAGELNKLGITKIRNLYFDEHVHYVHAVRGSKVAQGAWVSANLSPDFVGKQLGIGFSNLLVNYSGTVAKAKRELGLQLPGIISLTVENVRHLPLKEQQPGSSASTFVYHSAPWEVLLKEMNRNSNNFVAAAFFQLLGGERAFARYVQQQLGLGSEELRVYNGSGYPQVIKGVKEYNEASCAAILKTSRALQALIAQQGGDTFGDVLSVAGLDAEGETSIVSRLYSSAETLGALAAKTGTVQPAISLAGLASTGSGPVFFSYFYSINGTLKDRQSARAAIKKRLVDLFQKFSGKQEIDYQPRAFLPFDSESVLTFVSTDYQPRFHPMASPYFSDVLNSPHIDWPIPADLLVQGLDHVPQSYLDPDADL